MSIIDAFSILVIDEIRVQPNLRNELNCLEAVLAIGEEGLDILLAILDGGDWPHKLAARGVKLLGNITPSPSILVRDFGDWHASTFKDKTAKYESLCRSSLLNLYWKEFDKAEKKVNEARILNDRWAYAHHLYELLRGLQENQDNACFELGLALQREPSIIVKRRIERAIRLLN